MKNLYRELAEKGLMKKEKIDFLSVRKVLGKARNNLKSARILLSEGQNENTFELAYEAMLSAGRALAFSFGLRPRAQGSHKIVIEFCRKVLRDSPPVLVQRFDAMRRKRHYLVYGAGLEISKTEAKGAIEIASRFLKEAEKMIRGKDPQKELFGETGKT